MIFIMSERKKKLGAPPIANSFHRTRFFPLGLPLGQVDSLMLWAAFLVLFCFFCLFLPQFSKGSDVSGLAPTLSINRFKSNKRGIFSRTCVHSPCLTVEQQGFFFLFFSSWSVICFAFLFLVCFSLFIPAECMRVSSVTVHSSSS